MRIKTLDKKLADLGFNKVNDTPDYLRYERLDRLYNFYHCVTIEHLDNCVYYIKSFAEYQTEESINYNSQIHAVGLTYEASNLFTRRMKAMITQNLKEGRY